MNTSLVILMLARRKAKLPFYLNALREKEYAEKYPGCLLNNFHNLLRFWQRHYLNKDKDSTCLENVSWLSIHSCSRMRFYSSSSSLGLPVTCLLSPPELVYPLQLLEGDGVGAAGLGQDFSLCHSELHRRALRGPGQRAAGRLTFAADGGRDGVEEGHQPLVMSPPSPAGRAFGRGALGGGNMQPSRSSWCWMEDVV